jgi:eukaryotic-like serine/threonine-protein kinase
MTFSLELHVAPKAAGYRIEALLGKGATSLVYRAYDVENNFPVALKSIRYPDQEGIYRLKQEFRSFCDFCHPNIVELYKLHVEDKTCFYTMELIDGLNFVAFARKRPESLRSCLAQLVDGLTAVHASGRLHRDLKPGNILVEATGRTVLLDFGLSAEARSSDSVLTQAQLYGGTPAYMAPEQLSGEPATEASDLYALGVVLFEALTGRRPFTSPSPLAHLLAAKDLPPSPRTIDPRAPEDLSELVLGLLAFEPSLRTPLSEVRRHLNAGSSLPSGAHGGPEGRAPPFVNRVAEIGALKAALDAALSGQRIVVQVSGVSGAGKSSLIEHFLAEARAELGALALRSRCHHRESVRYNAVDGLIDTLSRHLVGQPEERLEAIIPGGLPALVTMFPVLGRISWPRIAMDDNASLADPQLLVKQAVEALGQLIGHISAGRPLVLWIDDLQWSDPGSIPLLARILSGGGGPILTLLSSRSEDLHSEAVVTAIEDGEAGSLPIEVRKLLVGPLEPQHVAELMRQVSGASATLDPGRLDEVLQASAGLPFFVLQFAAEAENAAPEMGLSTVFNPAAKSDVNRLVTRRLALLSPAQRAILEIVAVASRPIADATVIRVGAHEGASGREIYRLMNQNLLRKAEVGGAGAVEANHERIRAAVLDAMSEPAKRARHLAIAEELAREDEQDHPMLVEHFLAADETQRALDHALLAARAARRRLAFTQAVDFLRLAARLKDPLADQAALAVELAGALADAGRSSEAADLFLRGAQVNRADPRAASAYEALAARHLLFSGRLSESRALHRKLFTDLGIAFPDSVNGAIRMSIVNRFAFAIGLRRLKPARAVASRDLNTARVDSLWAAAIGFLMLDFVVGDALLTRFMREAAALGEPSRLIRATALEASAMANIGQPWTMRRAEKLLARSAALAAQSLDPYDSVVLLTCRMSALWQRGLWSEAAELAKQAIEKHRRECVRYDFVVSIAQNFRIAALAMAGALQTLRADALEGIAEARARGDVYVSRALRSGYYVYAALADDSAASIVADSEALLKDLPSDRFTSLHWLHFVATTNALVYAGEPWEAWALIERQWPLIRSAGFLRLGCIGAHLFEFRARVSLSCSAAGPPPAAFGAWTRSRLWKLAAQDAAHIARRPFLSHAQATAAAIRAAIAAAEGDTERQATELETAMRGFKGAGMALHQHAAVLRLAALPSRASVWSSEDSLGHLVREGVRRPERVAAFLMFAL